MQSALGVALPVFAIVLCGYLAGRYGLLGQGAAGNLNAYVYYFALPALLFTSLAEAPVGELANWAFVGADLVGIAVSFVASAALARWAYRVSLSTSAMRGMIASFGNTGYMGIPLLIAAFGRRWRYRRLWPP